MRIIKKILIILAVIVLVVAAVGFLFFPSHIHVERNVVINQKQDVLFNYVNDLTKWNTWSPWHELDTTTIYVFAGPASGEGATMKWESKNKNVGKGSMKFVEVKPDSLIREELNFMEQGVANSYFRFSPSGEGTNMVWGFDVEAGANPLMRIMGKFMDGMIGKDFEKGLATLKKTLESMPAPASTDTTKVSM